MRDGLASVTAQRVAAYRLSFDRPAVPFGDAGADERLAADVAASASVEPSERMGRYLRARTAFFDRVVISAIGRGIAQVLVVGAGYDGRALRYAKAGVRWFEVDYPATQRDKLARLKRLGIDAGHVTFLGADLRDAGLASAVAAAGLEPGSPCQIICEGVAVYLDIAVLQGLLAELRALATAGTRLALSTSVSGSLAEQGARERFRAAVAAVREPAQQHAVSAGHRRAAGPRPMAYRRVVRACHPAGLRGGRAVVSTAIPPGSACRPSGRLALPCHGGRSVRSG